MRFAFIKPLFVLLLIFEAATAQNIDTPILRTILVNYYKNEKPIYKGRTQLLFFFCEKTNNNEEIYETVNQMKLPANEVKQIKKQVVSDINPENWAGELEEIYVGDQTKLQTKINSCLSLEQYQAQQKRFNLNNQRLMIVSKPVYFANGNRALVKVVFYRSIEHNNGSVLVMEKNGNNWTIKDFLNSWST